MSLKVRNFRKSFHVAWFDHWEPVLDDALAVLPEMKGCPHELYRALAARSPSSGRKRTALITRQGDPMAVAAIRQVRGNWIPVVQYLAPASIFPAHSDVLDRVPALLGVNIKLAWWCMMTEPPHFLNTRSVETQPTFKMNCAEDIEKYWHSSGQLRAVKRARKRCEGLEVAVNAQGAMEWTLRNWHEKYHEDRFGDRMLAAHFLQNKGDMFVVSLSDGNKLIASEALCVYRSEWIFTYNYRDPEYDWYGLGNFLIDYCYKYASERGVEKLDLGGFAPDYKKKWAPQDGYKWQIRVCPAMTHASTRLRTTYRRMRRLLSSG